MASLISMTSKNKTQSSTQAPNTEFQQNLEDKNSNNNQENNNNNQNNNNFQPINNAKGN